MGVDDEGPPLVIVATVQFSRTAEEATPGGLPGSVSQNSTACGRAVVWMCSPRSGRRSSRSVVLEELPARRERRRSSLEAVPIVPLIRGSLERR